MANTKITELTAVTALAGTDVFPVVDVSADTTNKVSVGGLLRNAPDGTAKPQGDDIVRSKTIAKVTSTTVSTTYSDGSYCVPCVLMAC